MVTGMGEGDADEAEAEEQGIYGDSGLLSMVLSVLLAFLNGLGNEYVKLSLCQSVAGACGLLWELILDCQPGSRVASEINQHIWELVLHCQWSLYNKLDGRQVWHLEGCATWCELLAGHDGRPVFWIDDDRSES